MESFLERVGRFVVTRRWLVAAIVFAATALAGVGLFSLRAQFSVEELHGMSSQEHRTLEELRDEFDIGQQTLPVLVTADDVLRPDTLTWMHRAATHFGGLDGVTGVDGVTTTPMPRLSAEARQTKSLEPPSLKQMLERVATGKLRISPLIEGEGVGPDEAQRLADAIADAPLIESRLITRDHKAALIVLHLDPRVQDNEEVAGIVDQIQAWLADHPPPDGVQASPTGLPFINATLVERMKHDQTILLPAALGLALLLLLFSFRWLPAIYLPVIAVVCAAVVLTGSMGWLGVPIDLLNNIVPVLVVIIGITDAIHLIHRYSHFTRSQTLDEASVSTFRTMAVACFLTSFTTAVGFLSLVVSQTTILGRFGLIAACGIVIAYFTIIVLVPAFLPTAGKPPESARETMLAGGLQAGLDFLADLHLQRPWLLTVLFLLVSAPAAVYGLVDLKVDNAVLDQFSPDDPIYQTVRRLESAGFGVRPVQIVFRSPDKKALSSPQFLDALDDYEDWVGQQNGVQQVTGPTDFLRETWYLSTGNKQARTADFPDQASVDDLERLAGAAGRNPLRAYLTADGDLARLDVEIRDIGGKATIELAERIRQRAEARFGQMPGVQVVVTGSALLGSKAIDVLINDLVSSLLLAFVVIFAFMAIVLRSLRLGLVSIPVTVLPLLTTAGYMAARDIPLNAATVIIFSISIGLAVDGAIHVLARFREEVVRGASTDDALRTAVRQTGEAVILMYAALTLGFALMLFSSFLPVRRFGELVSVTVLTCLISTLVLLPPLLKLVWGKSAPKHDAPKHDAPAQR